jgi:hypothetical protein
VPWRGITECPFVFLQLNQGADMTHCKAIVLAFLAASTLSVCASAFSQENASYSAEVQAQKTWRETIRNTIPPKKGACYHVSYPSNVWKEVACVTAPNIPFAQHLPSASQIKNIKAGMDAQPQTVGDGNDYVAQVPGLMDLAVGQFSSFSTPGETGSFGANDYSLQLNSNFMSSPACNGHSGCMAWQQFIYSSHEQMIFIQYWLLGYNGTCPSGWTAYSDDCYTNSSAVTVAQIPVSDLINVDLWAGAGSTSDSMLFTTGSYHPGGGADSYSFTTPTSVIDLVAGWKQSEFNIFGDGGGSEAVFTPPTTIGVRIQLQEQGSTQTAPTCVPDAGTTGETNNLTLGPCTSGIGVSGSTNPYISFTESN